MAELVRAYSEGETSTSLAKRMGVSKQTVVRALCEEGVPTRFQPLTEAQRVESVHRYEAGESVQQIATQVEFDFETVRQVLIAEGVSRRAANGR